MSFHGIKSCLTLPFVSLVLPRLFNMMLLALFGTLALAAANAQDCLTQLPSQPGLACMSKSEVCISQQCFREEVTCQ